MLLLALIELNQHTELHTLYIFSSCLLITRYTAHVTIIQANIWGILPIKNNILAKLYIQYFQILLIVERFPKCGFKGFLKRNKNILLKGLFS